jgi:D-glycero-D-manno-heptose 1,7-bisphosphate phosphatase
VVRAVFLDRDGVINANIERAGRAVAPTELDQFEFLPGVAGAVVRLKAAGFLVVVITNQPDVATGLTPRATVDEMHRRIRASMPVDDIKVCFHVDRDNCTCRKPKPGLIREAEAEYGVDLSASYVVGDRWRDVEAGQGAGCHTILVGQPDQQERPCRPDKAVPSLPDAVEYILSQQQPGAAP